MKKITILLMMMIAVWGCKKEEVIPPVVADFTFVEGTNGEFKFTNTSLRAKVPMNGTLVVANIIPKKTQRLSLMKTKIIPKLIPNNWQLSTLALSN